MSTRAGDDQRAAATTHTFASRALEGVRLVLIALWLGGAFFFSFVVAPTAFSVLPTHELAGALVTRTIAVVNVGGFVTSLLLLVSAFAIKDRWDVSRRAWLGELASLAIIALASGIGHWFISARMIALRAAMGRPIDQVLADDPLRLAFNSLHAYSVATMCVALVAGVVALLLIGRRNRMVLVSKVESLDR
jgi:hypothetical protein